RGRRARHRRRTHLPHVAPLFDVLVGCFLVRIHRPLPGTRAQAVGQDRRHGAVDPRGPRARALIRPPRRRPPPRAAQRHTNAAHARPVLRWNSRRMKPRGRSGMRHQCGFLGAVWLVVWLAVWPAAEAVEYKLRVVSIPGTAYTSLLLPGEFTDGASGAG